MKTKTRNGLKIFSAILLSLLALWIVLALFPRQSNFKGENPMQKTGELPILIAHGGGNGEFPDNTLEAFYNAYSVDKNVMMETDVSITRDGVVILSHDTTIDRKTDNVGNIADWNYTDLIEQQVNFAYTNETEKGKLVAGTERALFKNEAGKTVLPTDVTYPDGVSPRHESIFLATTLEELLVAFPENRINVEIKQEGELGLRALAEILRLLEKYDAYERVVLASFHPEIYDEFLRLKEEKLVPDGFMFSPATSGVAKYFILKTLGLDILFADGICVFQIPMEEYGLNFAKKSLVDNAHKHNLAVHYWTINDVDEMRYLISIGADGIMTDYPHRLAAVYEEYKNK